MIEPTQNYDSRIPNQLRTGSFGFVKLAPRSKKPVEKNWTNSPHSFHEINEWVGRGNNYGVLGGVGGLIVVDADTPELSAVVESKLPPTMTVSTGKGKHYYFLCDGIAKKIVLTVQLPDESAKHHGEIISNGSQVVGPGSIHPTGSESRVVRDLAIATISPEQIYSELSEFISPGTIPRESKQVAQLEFKKLINEYGNPFYPGKDGAVVSINQNFWAGLNQFEHEQFFEPDESAFYRYDPVDGLHKKVTEDAIKQEIASRMLKVSRELGLPSLEQKRTNSNLNHIIGQLRGISERKEAFLKREKFVHLANGIVVLDDNGDTKFCEFSPAIISRNQSPITFDPAARCERFLGELVYPALTEEDAVLLQKYVGLCLLGNNLIQRFLILDGEPGRGKSTLSLVIQSLVGQSNVTELRTKYLADRFELYRYLDKHLLVGVDVPGRFLSERGAHVIKGLVGGDVFDAERKGGTGSYQLRGNFCVVITSNSRLQVSLDGDIGAWKRRLLIIRFEGPAPAKKIPDFKDLLMREEGSGILNWGLQGLTMVLKDIAARGDIELSASQENIVEGLLAESDSLRRFLVDKVVSDPDSDLSTTEIVEAYAEYCPLQCWTAKPITIVHRELESLMLELFRTSKANSLRRHDKSTRGFRRVAFRKED